MMYKVDGEVIEYQEKPKPDSLPRDEMQSRIAALLTKLGTDVLRLAEDPTALRAYIKRMDVKKHVTDLYARGETVQCKVVRKVSRKRAAPAASKPVVTPSRKKQHVSELQPPSDSESDSGSESGSNSDAE